MNLAFTKMQGLGNDFLILDGSESSIELDTRQVRSLADRRLGIGCDQILLIETNGQSGFGYRVINADGSEVEQCGNGARCIARFLHDRQRVASSFELASVCGPVRVNMLAGHLVQLGMGIPDLEPASIPLCAENRRPQYELKIQSRSVMFSALSMGNPHAVIQVECIDQAPVASLGPAVQDSEWFPQGVNVGFMQVLDSARIRLRVFERGVGETPACGSGACAAVVAGCLSGDLDPVVSVSLPGGELQIQWAGEGHQVLMTGPAQYVFEGNIEI